MEKAKHAKEPHLHENHTHDAPLPHSFVEGVAQTLATVTHLEKQLNDLGLASLTKEERQYSTGKFRSGEEVAVDSVLKTVESYPTYFGSIADKDHGNDPSKVETAPSREALARRAALVPLAAAIERLASRVSDDILASGEQVKDVTIPAYAIIRANAPLNDDIRRSAADALNFYPPNRSKKRPPAGGTPTPTT